MKFYAHDYGTKMKRIFGVRADQGLELGGLWSRLYGDSMGGAWQNVKGPVRAASSFDAAALA